MTCSLRCRRAGPGHCCCDCGGRDHGIESTVRQLPGPWGFFVAEHQSPDDPGLALRVSVERDGLLLVPGRRVDVEGNETLGWIAAERSTRRRLAWGLSQEEALARAKASRR